MTDGQRFMLQRGMEGFLVGWFLPYPLDILLAVCLLLYAVSLLWNMSGERNG